MKGLRQGDAVACMIFNIAVECAIQNAGIERNGTIYNKSIQIIAYADDSCNGKVT
jgi:hypothetical protein